MEAKGAIAQLERLLKGTGQVWLAFDEDGHLTHARPSPRQAGILDEADEDLSGQLVLKDVIPVDIWQQAKNTATHRGIWQSILPLAHSPTANTYADVTLSIIALPDEAELYLVALRSLSNPHEVSHMKKTFMRMVMHELRTPLMAIKGLSKSLGDSSGSSEINVQEYTSLIENSADGLISIVEKIIAVVKIQAGDVWLDSEPISLGTVVRDVANQMADRAAVYNQQVEVVVPDDLPPVLADVVVVEQVLENVLENALSYAGREADIRIEATYAGSLEALQVIVPDAQDFPCVVLSVADNGMGVRIPRQMDIFKPFVRGESPGVKLPPGTGLGLTITRALLELAGGTIWVESEIGQGSTFVVTLPVARQRHATALSRRGSQQADELVLLVTPDRALYPELQQRLEDGGYAVQRVSDVNEAASIVQEQLPLLVMLGQLPDGALSENDLVPLAGAAAQNYIPVVTFVVTRLPDGATGYRVSEPLPAPLTLEQTFSRVNLLVNRASRRERHVLVVEDNVDYQMMVAAALSVRQLNVQIASTAERARELVQTSNFDLIVMDVVLADGDGLNLLAEFREIHRLAAIPAIIMSAEARNIPDAHAKAFSLGAVEFLEKPFSIHTLVRQIDDMLVN